MSFKPKPTSNQPLIPAGLHRAICYSIIDLGTQKTSYEGQDTGWKEQINITFELPEVRGTFKDADGNEVDKPRVVGKTYTLSFYSEAALAKLYLAWQGKELKSEKQIPPLLGENCQVMMAHKTNKDGSLKSKMVSITPLSGNMEIMKPENPMVIYEIEQGEPPAHLPNWMKEEIKKSREFQAMSDNAQELPCDYNGSEPTPGDDIPWE